MSFIASPRKIPKQSFVFLSLSLSHSVTQSLMMSFSFPPPYMSLLLSIYAVRPKKSTSRLRENVHSELYGNLRTNTRHIIHPLKVVIIVVFLFSFSHFIFPFLPRLKRWCIFMFVDALHKFVSLSFLGAHMISHVVVVGVKWDEAFLEIRHFSCMENVFF